jgi:uncharacterized damage-inducible protein DinB
MAWANQQLLMQLAQLTPAQSELCAPGSEWSVSKIAYHLVDSQRWYVWRLAGDDCSFNDSPEDAVDYVALAGLLATADARLREEAALPEAMTEYEREGKLILRARSTILAQAIHHATEHRAQIADTLAAHGIALVDLDELDVWAYGTAEGLGA